MDKSVRFFAEYEEHRFFDLLSFDLRVGAREKRIDSVKGAFAGSEAGSNGSAEKWSVS